MMTQQYAVGAVALVLACGCDPLWTLEGNVRDGRRCVARDISDVQVSIRCPSRRGDEQVRTTPLGHFLLGKVDDEQYEDDCRLHLEKEGFETIDVSVRSVKVSEEGQTLFVRIPFTPILPTAERPEDAGNVPPDAAQ